MAYSPYKRLKGILEKESKTRPDVAKKLLDKIPERIKKVDSLEVELEKINSVFREAKTFSDRSEINIIMTEKMQEFQKERELIFNWKEQLSRSYGDVIRYEEEARKIGLLTREDSQRAKLHDGLQATKKKFADIKSTYEKPIQGLNDNINRIKDLIKKSNQDLKEIVKKGDNVRGNAVEKSAQTVKGTSDKVKEILSKSEQFVTGVSAGINKRITEASTERNKHVNETLNEHKKSVKETLSGGDKRMKEVLQKGDKDAKGTLAMGDKRVKQLLEKSDRHIKEVLLRGEERIKEKLLRGN